MKRDYLGHAVTLALAVAASAVINAKCPPEPVPAGKPAPAPVAPVVPVAPAVDGKAPAPMYTPASEVKAQAQAEGKAL